ncbi:hypothetical protein ACP70R_050159 [Stipagrostis hirtigluma subsp. patula]
MSPVGLFFCVIAIATVPGLKSQSSVCSENLRAVAGPQENILISPLNTYIALSALHLGASHGTRADLAKILKVPANSTELTESNLHETLAKIVKSIQRQPDTDSYPLFTKVELANGLFVQEGFPVKETYKKRLVDYYNGTAQNVDFKKGSESTNLINNWVSQKTFGRIPKLYEEPLESSTLAILLSTLYFNGTWKEEFSSWATKEEKFNTGSAEITVPMMSGTGFVLYHSNPSLQYDAISLPYDGDDYAMIILLPHLSQTVKNLTDHLHLVNLLSVKAAATITYVQYKIPKMKFSWKKSLAEALKAESIFNNPDLSELTPMAMKISEMIHATEIEVDEKGTVASAVTGAQAVASSGFFTTEKPIPFHVTRSFLFGISHKPTCTLLFSGSVHKPM